MSQSFVIRFIIIIINILLLFFLYSFVEWDVKKKNANFNLVSEMSMHSYHIVYFFHSCSTVLHFFISMFLLKRLFLHFSHSPSDNYLFFLQCIQFTFVYHFYFCYLLLLSVYLLCDHLTKMKKKIPKTTDIRNQNQIIHYININNFNYTIISF